MPNYRYKRRAARSKFEPAGAWKPNTPSWSPSAGRPDFTRHTALPGKSRRTIPLSRGLPAGPSLKHPRNSNAAGAGIAVAAVGVGAAVAFSRSKTGKKLRRNVAKKMHHSGAKKKTGGGGSRRHRRDRRGRFA